RDSRHCMDHAFIDSVACASSYSSLGAVLLDRFLPGIFQRRRAAISLTRCVVRLDQHYWDPYDIPSTALLPGTLSSLGVCRGIIQHLGLARLCRERIDGDGGLQ